MNQSETIIENPVQLPPKFVSKFNIRVVEIKLFEYINVAVNLFDSNNNFLETKIYKIENDEYTNWGNDDSYIVDLIKYKIENNI